MRILIAILAMLPAALLAATLTLNGQACGTISETRIDGAGNVAFTTDGQCGSVTPPPVDPPVTPPASCPAGVVCIDRTFPIIRQEVVSIRAGQILAFRVNTGASGVGTVYTNNTANLSPNRRVALSTVAGDLNPPNSRCGTSGFESTTSGYVVGTPVDRKCTLPTYSVVYFNVKAPNCPDGKRCEFLLRAN